MKINNKSGYIYILLSAVFFALGGLLIKVNTWSSMTINGMRGIIAFFMIGAEMFFTGHRFRFNMPVLFGAIVNFLMSATFVMANKLTTAANTIVLQFTMPVFIIFFLWIFWKQKPDMISLVTVFVSFVGIVFFFIGRISPTGMLGNILAILSGLFYSIVFLIKKIPNSDFESSILLSFGLSFVVGIPFLMRETDFSGGNIASIFALGIFQIGCAYICLNRGLNQVPPIAASLISMIEPILNPILVAIFYGEMIGYMEVVGAIIVLGSATFYNVMLIKGQEK